MLSGDIKQKLLDIKFREEVITHLDELAQNHQTDLLISGNKHQPDSRLGKAFGVKIQINNSVLEETRTQLAEKLPQVYAVYEIGNNPTHTHLAVIRPTDKYEILRIMGTSSEEKYDLDTGTLLARLRRWEEEHGLELLGAGDNWVKLRILHIPGELRDFAEELIRFAPGTRDADNVKAIEATLKSGEAIIISW